jgi:predicted Rossmann-fold nucleotide-binding protein
MQEMADKGTISPEDLSLVLLTDSIAEAVQHIDTFIKKNYRLRPPRRRWWLFERKPALASAASPTINAVK